MGIFGDWLFFVNFVNDVCTFLNSGGYFYLGDGRKVTFVCIV